MPKLTLQKSGVKLARAAGCNMSPSKRGQVNGWSIGSARRNDDFLRSVDPDTLTEIGVSFSLTIRDLPASHEDWEKLRRAFLKRIERRGLVRLHWLTEFQKRGAPHLHGIAFFDASQDRSIRFEVVRQWLQVTKHLGSAPRGQHSADITDLAGWLMYLGKHGARSVNHYQRSGALPSGWLKTGRLWGKLGHWPTSQSEFYVSPDIFYKLRRFATKLQLADAVKTARKYATHSGPEASYRVKTARRRISYLRRRHKAPTRQQSELRGVSDWANSEALSTYLKFLAPDAPHYRSDYDRQQKPTVPDW